MKLNAIEMKKVTTKNNEEIMIKPWLNLAEIELVSEKMLEHDEYTMQQHTKYSYLLQICTNIEKLEELDWDMLAYNGIFDLLDYEIENICEIDNYIEHHINLENSMERFLNKALKSIEKLEKKIPTSKKMEAILGNFAEAVKINDKNKK